MYQCAKQKAIKRTVPLMAGCRGERSRPPGCAGGVPRHALHSVRASGLHWYHAES